MADVLNFPKQEEPEWIIGPFAPEYHVAIEGRHIEQLTAKRGDANTMLMLDGRFLLEVPNELAYQVAHFTATALAIGAGYSHIGAETKDGPFAPKIARLDSTP